jgi:hypothetical protein
MKTYPFFAFDIHIHPYLLEKEVGKVNFAGPAALPGKTLIFRKTKDFGFAKADFQDATVNEDLISGTVYQLSYRQLLKLRKRAKAGYDSILEEVAIQYNENESQAWTLRPDPASPTCGDTPFDWYLQLMIEGGEKLGLPAGGIQKLRAIPTGADARISRVNAFTDFLNYGRVPEKIAIPFISQVKSMNRGGTFHLDLDGHVYHQRKVIVRKRAEAFEFQTSTKIIPGLQDNKEFKTGKRVPLLKNQHKTMYIPGIDFLLSNIAYDDQNQKILRGSISGFSSTPARELEDKYHRFIVPVTELPDLPGHFQSYAYRENGTIRQGLIKLNIHGGETHFYSQAVEKQHFLFIDSLVPLPFKKFQETAHAILLTYALLRGEYLSGETYIFAGSDSAMEHVEACYYHKMSAPISGLPGIFTTNGFTGFDSADAERGDDGGIHPEELAKINEGMEYFPDAIFSKICEEVLTNEKTFRSLLMLVHNQKSTLEIKIPVQYVALEALTSTFVNGGNKDLKPILDDNLAAELISRINGVIDHFSGEKKFSDADIARLVPLKKKVGNLNQPPNADKLSESFKLISYTLSKDEFDVIKLRDKFLHGSTISVTDDEDYGFKDLFHISLRLHFMLSVLLLKKAGFEGKILNHVKLYEAITEKKVDEERFIKI